MTEGSSRGLVLLAAHGAGDGSWANRRVEELAEELSQSGLRTKAGFHLGNPSIEEVLRAKEPVRTVLPLFAAPGYFATERIPARASEVDPQVKILEPICSSLGFVRAAVDAVLKPLKERAAAAPFRQILVVGHGTERHPGSRVVVDRVVAALERRLPWLGMATVTPAFLDQKPRIGTVWPGLDGDAVVLPLMLGGGPHVEALRNLVKERPGSRILPGVLEWPILTDLLRSHVHDAEAQLSFRRVLPASAPRLWGVR